VSAGWCNRSNKWRATRWINRKCTSLGYYAKEEEAAGAYDDSVRHGIRNVRAGSSSRFRCVSWNKAARKRTAKLGAGGYRGLFRDEKDAARRYDDEARKLGRPADDLNAIDDDGDDDDGDGDENRGDHDDTAGASMRSGVTGMGYRLMGEGG
jgi:hypothetical protein